MLAPGPKKWCSKNYGLILRIGVSLDPGRPDIEARTSDLNFT